MAGTSEAVEIHPSLAHLKPTDSRMLRLLHPGYFGNPQAGIFFASLVRFTQNWHHGHTDHRLLEEAPLPNLPPETVHHLFGGAPDNQAAGTAILELVKTPEAIIANLVLTRKPWREILSQECTPDSIRRDTERRYRAEHDFHMYPTRLTVIKTTGEFASFEWMHDIEGEILAAQAPRRLPLGR